MYYLAGLFSEAADEFDILMLQVCVRVLRAARSVCASIRAAWYACAVCLCFGLCFFSA